MSYNQPGRIRISERFEKVQFAQRALHPLTIQLLNEKRGIFGAAARVDGVGAEAKPEEDSSQLRTNKFNAKKPN